MIVPVFLGLILIILVGKLIFQKPNPVVIVPHFDLFQAQRQELLKDIASKYQPKKIVLLSVDHYRSGRSEVSTTERDWDFKDKTIRVDRDGVERLSKMDFVTNEENPFIFEHGIKNVLPDLSEYFPRAEIVPIMVRDDIASEKMEDIFNEIFAVLPDSMPVFSIDFSHYNPSSMAKIHDAYSIDSLKNLNEKNAFLAETDSPQLMNIAVRWAKKTNNKRFNLVFNSDSGEKSNDLEMETTSVVLGYYSRGVRQYSRVSTSIFGGDSMFDRLVYETYKDKKLEKVFYKLGPRLFRGVDLSIVNLEGPIAQNATQADITRDDLVFNFSIETLDALKYLKLNTVCLANNHTNGAGKPGLEETMKRLEDVGISTVGSYDNSAEYLSKRIESSLPLTIISTNELVDSGKIDGLIKQEKEAGRFVMIYAHWGAEYSETHIGKQRELAESWHRDGADLIIGSHPHVIEDFELVDGAPVIYSLGNLVFDQNFSKQTNEGLIVGVVIDREGIKLSLFPVKIMNQTPELMRGKRRLEILDQLLGSTAGFERINSDTILINRK